MFAERCSQLEYLDLGPDFYTKEEYGDCLQKLASIGRCLGGNSSTLQAFGRLPFVPESILDVGCGGGDFARLLAKRYPAAKVVGIDTSADAIAYAQGSPSIENLAFEHRAQPKLTEAAKSYDVVTATLVCHHLSDQDLSQFLKDMLMIAKRAVIINDLHRHPMAYYGFIFLSRLFFRNRLIQHDGPLSVRRGFIRQDWERHLAEVPCKRWKMSWNWAFRWVIVIDV